MAIFFSDDTLKFILMNKNLWIETKIPLQFIPKGPINNIPAMVQIMACRRPGAKPLSKPMVVRLSTYICYSKDAHSPQKYSQYDNQHSHGYYRQDYTNNHANVVCVVIILGCVVHHCN